MLPPLDPNALLADFIPPDDWVSPSPLRDRERGSLALNDPTGGLQQADWEGEMVDQDYWIKLLPDGTPDDVLSITGTAIEAKFTFDLEMRPHVTWADSTSSWLYWYDPDLSGYALMELPGATSPRLTLDDKRSVAVNPSVLLFYILNGRLCVRSHRDRFQTATSLGLLPEGVTGLGRVGMSVDYRLQIEFFLAPGYTSCEPLAEPAVFGDELTTAGTVTAGSVHRNLYTVATGIYPIEVDDEMAAQAWISNGWQMAAQIEGFEPGGQLVSGEIIQILVPIDFWQEPEAFAPDAQLLSGIIYTTLNPVSFWQDPESFQPDAQLLSGYFTEEAPSVSITNPPEEMTSTSWIVSGTLE